MLRLRPLLRACCRYVGAAEIAHILQSSGERVTDDEVRASDLQRLKPACMVRGFNTRNASDVGAQSRSERDACLKRALAKGAFAAPRWTK